MYIRNINNVQSAQEYKHFLQNNGDQIINNLNNHKVNINVKHWDMSHPFNGKFTNLGLQFIGLEQGIKNVYNKLKNEY